MESGGDNKDLEMENEENDDDVEIPPIGSGSETVDTSCALSRRRLKSDVWGYFNILPLGPDKKQRCKCKKCGVTYACPSNFGTGNLHKHLEKCVRRDTRDIGQLLITRESSSLNLTTPKFSQEKYRELFVAAITMHEEPFQFVEYEGFRALNHYLNNKVQTISRNTCKADVLKNYVREKERKYVAIDSR
ncbi:Zinc finger, BED-type [Heracleum sosnowskyi]|uniref:Zinc finger, BED-type n=1 Tax=Heracleum sosnowskyi TaxID=360622 RepID=A0AAD8ISS6_9APIA|nr:Zinc finger, BED-type [Heracleum sosnowskyi]